MKVVVLELQSNLLGCVVASIFALNRPPWIVKAGCCNTIAIKQFYNFNISAKRTRQTQGPTFQLQVKIRRNSYKSARRTTLLLKLLY